MTTSLNKISTQEVHAKFDSWVGALAKGHEESAKHNHEKHGVAGVVADQYEPEAVLLPTVKYKVCDERAFITDYFDHFVQSKPVGVVTQEMISTGEIIAVQGGAYDFTLTDKTDSSKVAVVPCDFTFISRKQPDGSMKFIHHHSSKKSQAADAPVLKTMASMIEQAYQARGEDATTSEASTMTRYTSAVSAVLTSDSFRNACQKENNSVISLGDNKVVALEDGYTLHCGHLDLLTEQKDGSANMLGHRFTLVFDQTGKMIHSQISKNPENDKGVTVTPERKNEVRAAAKPFTI